MDVGGNPFFYAALGELRHEFRMVHDRPGNQMGKEPDEQDVAKKSQLRRLALIGVDQECDLGECEKRDAQRQGDLQRLEMPGGDGGPIGQREVGVFEVGECGEVGGDAQGEQAFL